MSHSSTDPGVHVPPPFMYAAGFLLGLGLSWLAPVDRLPRLVQTPAEIAGVVLIALSLMLGAWAMITFVRARTAILPFKRASAMVTTGPYRFTRNPMYLGLAMLYLGMSLAINRLWPLALLPLVLVVIDRFVIAREEQHLEARFGERYRDYRRRVRRWVARSTRD